MSSFPNIKTPSGINSTLDKGLLRDKFENGYVHSRVRHTKSRHTWKLSWPGMVQTDLDSLLTHWDENIGGSFLWVDPLTDNPYTVMYSEGSLSYEFVSPGVYRVALTLEEV